MASFPGAETKWKSVPPLYNISNPVVSQLENKASSTSYSVGSRIEQLRMQAEAYADKAYDAIDECEKFNRRVQDVHYIRPEMVRADLKDIAMDDSSGGIRIPNLQSAAQFNGMLSLADAPEPQPDIGAPSMSDLQVTPAPTPSFASIAVPAKPTVDTINVEPPPQLDVAIRATPEVMPPGSAPELQFAVKALPVAQPVSLPSIDDSEVLQALERLRTAAAHASADVPPYELLIPEVFEVAGSLLAGDLVIPAQDMLSQARQRIMDARIRHDQVMSRVWARMGFQNVPSDDAVSLYNATEREEEERQTDVRNDAAMIRWLDDSLLDAYQVAVAAHGNMIDLEIALYDAEWNANMALAEAMLELVRAAIISYRAGMAKLQAAMEAHSLDYIDAETEAMRRNLEIDAVEQQARLNSAIGEAFEAEERSKAQAGDQFRAEVGMNEARSDAYRAFMRSLAAHGEALGADLEAFKVEALQWLAGLEEARTQYKLARARARATVQQNRQQALVAKMSGISNQLVAVEARRAAEETAARAAMLKARAQGRAAGYSQIEAANAIASSKSSMSLTRYEAQIAAWGGGMHQQVAIAEGVASERSAAARFYQSMTEATSRAATLSQSARAQIARAHQMVDEAAGRAGAAVESGRLSGYRASASVSASGSLSASRGSSLSMGESYNSGVTESNHERLEEKR